MSIKPISGISSANSLTTANHPVLTKQEISLVLELIDATIEAQSFFKQNNFESIKNLEAVANKLDLLELYAPTGRANNEPS